MKTMKRMFHLIVAMVMLLSCFQFTTALAADTVTVTVNVSNTPVRGDILLENARRVLSDEYPELAEKFKITLPDEKFRRVGQSMAAASLPEIVK